jgi:hypothetical protein
MSASAARGPARSRAGRHGAAAAALLLLVACAGTPAPERGRESALPRNAVLPAASDDWHSLLVVPFGTLLRASPVALHEVLLFHGESQPAADGDGTDCYSPDAGPPRFVERRPDEYMLCFTHDRLSRIEASVRLAGADAAATFARACGLWRKVPAPPPQAGNECAGRDGGVAFSARLGSAAGDAAPVLSITLSAAVAEAESGAGQRNP